MKRQETKAKKKQTTHYSIDSIDTFIDVLKFVNFTKQVLTVEESDFAGYKSMFEVFYVELRGVLAKIMPNKSTSSID